MINALFQQPTYNAVKRLMDATVMRHEAIAANLANVGTPGYRRVDVAPTFEAQLQAAVKSGDFRRVESLRPALVTDTTAVARRRDGNTVDFEGELVRLNQNTVEHAVEAQLVSSSLQRMRMAITGRP
jgi:flagellar basal-body rod protein FlgB